MLGIKAYPTIAEMPEAGRPGGHRHARRRPCPASSRECAEAGVKGAIIISAGFKEIGPEGAELEQQVLAEARARQMRIIGPNCLGVMSPSPA